MGAAAGAAVASRNIDDTDFPREFLFAAIVHCLQFFRGRKENIHRNVGVDGVVYLLFDREEFVRRNDAVKIDGDDVLVHMETYVVKTVLLMNEAGNDVFSGVVLHVVVAAGPVEYAFDGAADREGLVRAVNDDARNALHVRNDCVAEFAVIGGLTAPFRIKRRVGEHDFKAVFSFGAGHDIGRKFAGVGVAVKEFVQIGHELLFLSC